MKACALDFVGYISISTGVYIGLCKLCTDEKSEQSPLRLALRVELQVRYGCVKKVALELR